MAVLQKIRVKFGLAISIIIALALLSFIIDPSTLETALNSMSSKYDVGQIAGKSVSYSDFQEDVDRYTTINQIMTGSSVQSEQAQKQIRDAAWQELVDRYMFVKNAKAAGITVGDDELVDLTSGDNISPLIAQNPAFADPQTGAFSVQKLLDFIEQAQEDESGQLKTFWSYLQNTVYNQAFYSKYGALFTGTSMDNALTLADAVNANNTTADVDYVLAMYPIAKDSTIEVSASEIKAYYKNHKNNFKRGASRDIEYVVFEVVPSAEDIESANNAISDVYDEFASTGNMKAFMLKNSERPLSEYWYKAGELSTVSKEISDFVDGAAAGAVSPVYRNGDSFFAAKVLASQPIADEISVKVVPAADAKEITPELLESLEAAEAMKMTQTYIIPGLECLFTAKDNEAQFIKTVQYGNLVAKVVERTAPVAKKQVAILEKTAIASKETINNYYSQANTFATITNGTFDGYKKAIDSLKVYSHPMNITEATANYGAIDQAREVTRWAFDSKVGKASQIISVNNKYFFIAALKGIKEEGFIPVKEVSSQISDRLYAEKLQAKAKADAAEKVAGLTDLEAIAKALNSTVETSEGLSFASAAGMAAVEPAVLGAAAAATEGEVFGPVAGFKGVYFVKVSNKQAGEFYTEEDAKNFSAQKAQYSSQMILPVMMDEADVKDNRARFF